MKLFHQILLTSALALPTVVSAASASQTLQVHVPFSFTVGAQQFAAGDYRVQQTETGVIFVQGEGKAAAAISVPCELKAGSPSSLRFAGSQQHELVGFQVEGESARSIPMPPEERKVVLSAAR